MDARAVPGKIGGHRYSVYLMPVRRLSMSHGSAVKPYLVTDESVGCVAYGLPGSDIHPDAAWRSQLYVGLGAVIWYTQGRNIHPHDATWECGHDRVPIPSSGSLVRVYRHTRTSNAPHYAEQLLGFGLMRQHAPREVSPIPILRHNARELLTHAARRGLVVTRAKYQPVPSLAERIVRTHADIKRQLGHSIVAPPGYSWVIDVGLSGRADGTRISSEGVLIALMPADGRGLPAALIVASEGYAKGGRTKLSICGYMPGGVGFCGHDDDEPDRWVSCHPRHLVMHQNPLQRAIIAANPEG